MYFITMSVLRGILIKRHYCFLCFHSRDFVKANVTRKHSIKVTNLNECKDFKIAYLHNSQGSCTGTHPLWGFWESISHHPLSPLKLSRGAVRTGRNRPWGAQALFSSSASFSSPLKDRVFHDNTKFNSQFNYVASQGRKMDGFCTKMSALALAFGHDVELISGSYLVLSTVCTALLVV